MNGKLLFNIVNLHQTINKMISVGKDYSLLQAKKCSQFYNLHDMTQQMEQPITV